MERHIFLVGMPGSGKSALGRRVALELQMPYLDTDAYLSEITGMNTAQIYESFGEEAFRDGETNLLRALINATPGIISTGGGTALREENQRIMRAQGYIVLIDRPIDDILMDIRAEKRPLLAQEGTRKRSSASITNESPYTARSPISYWTTGNGFHNGLAALSGIARRLRA